MQEAQVNRNIYDPRLWKRFWEIARPYWVSEQKWKAFTLLAILLALPISLHKSMALFYSFLAQSSTALETRDPHLFKEVILKIPVAIAAVALSGVFLTYLGNRLSYEWQLWLTTRFLEKYFGNRAFYHISATPEIDNPDQRICDSIGSFTGIAIGFITICHNSIVALVIHTGVLWSISARLCLLLLLYAAIGTVVASLFGKRLISLNFKFLQSGADFRYGLLQIRENAESIAFYRGENRENAKITEKVREMIGVQRMLIGWERNLELFTAGHAGYNYFLPFLVLAPLFLSGKLPFGDITRASLSFGQVYFALVIAANYLKLFGRLATETTRLETFETAMSQAATGKIPAGASTIDSKTGSRLALDNLTVQTPDYQHILLREATAEISPGRGLLIAGDSGSGKSSLLRSIAGLWNAGDGQITRPPLEEMFFLPQRPYLVLGSLREQLTYPRLDGKATDGELEDVLAKVNLEGLAERFGGFDVVMDWGRLLSPGEQQRLAFARLLLTMPRYAVLDEATSALDVNNEARLYRHLRESGMTYVSVGHRPTLLDYHDNVLELQGGGNWRLMSTDEFRTASAA